MKAIEHDCINWLSFNYVSFRFWVKIFEYQHGRSVLYWIELKLKMWRKHQTNIT